MILKFIKWLVGLLLLPACWAVSLAAYGLYQSSVGTEAVGDFEAWALPIGFVFWVLIFFVLPRPIRTYVLGHELTHALWAIMMGGRIGRMKVSKSGGHVELSKTNFLITLAPYFFPFYTFLVIAAYYLISVWLEMELWLGFWLAAVGLTWSFHLTFTIHMLTQRQPDIQEHGAIFSYAVIYAMNVLLIGIWMVVIGSPTFAGFADVLQSELASAYAYSFQQLRAGWIFVSEWLAAKAASSS